MSYKSIAVVGDSIANGYWDQPFEGWVARTVKKLSADRPYEIGLANFAVDGDRICDMYHRFCSNVISMQSKDVLWIVATANDLIRWHTPTAQLDISPVMREEYWLRLLETAQKIFPQIFIFGIDCADETRNPSVGVNDWKYYTLNQDIRDYNRQIENIAKKFNIPFLNTYAVTEKMDWPSMLHDGAHPNADGHAFLADLAYQFLKDKI